MYFIVLMFTLFFPYSIPENQAQYSVTLDNVLASVIRIYRSTNAKINTKTCWYFYHFLLLCVLDVIISSIMEIQIYIENLICQPIPDIDALFRG